MESSQTTQIKILIIRFLGLADVASIGLPAIRHYQKMYPNSEIHFLTFAEGKDIIELAEPCVKVKHLAKNAWPAELLPAMEAFLGLAEEIIGEAYDQIINLDTSFMPCFLSRFLKDAGERFMGNSMNLSVQGLIESFQAQTLQPEYVQEPSRYMESTFSGMEKWYTRWWQSRYVPENGYPEYYLSQCCQLDNLEFDMAIDVPADELLQKRAEKQKVILLANEGLSAYSELAELKNNLQQKGYFVWQESLSNTPIKMLLAMLKATDLMISFPSELYWLAKSVNCPAVLLTDSDSVNLTCPEHILPILGENLPSSEQIIDKIEVIFS